MVNNSTNINKTNNQLSSLTELTEHKQVKIQNCSKVKLVNVNSNPTRLTAGSPTARFIYYISHKIYSKVLILHDLTETKQ